MQFDSYEIRDPKQRVGSVLFASPHSGRTMPKGFVEESLLTELQIRSSEDAFVDDLYADAPDLGAPLLRALVPRAYVDFNRSSEDLDPALIQGLRRKSTNPRVVSGLGVIPRVVANGRHIYRGKIDLEDAHQRIKRYWRPYHDQLRAALDTTFRDYGEAVLIDCHSMPSEALDALVTSAGKRPDIVLGDRFGASSAVAITDKIAGSFEAQGFSVSRNVPFAGAFIAQNYGRPALGQHVIQVELNRALYMDERKIEKLPDFDDVKTRISAAMAEIIEIGRDQVRLAAE